MTTVHVAVAVIWRSGRVLIGRRPRHAHQGDLLEFPGGKVEPGETVQQALVREIAEETALDLDPRSLEPLLGIRHDYGDKRVFLDVWSAYGARGEPLGLEGQPLFWRHPDELRDSDFPAANRAIIRALQLPPVLAITGAFPSPGRGLEQLAASLERSRPAWVVLRAPWLDQASYRALARAAAPLVERHQARLLVHGDPAALTDLPAAGVHLPWRQARALGRRPGTPGSWLGISCHNAAELAHARRLGADYVTLGPVAPTPSHPGARVLGWSGLAQLATQADLPVYALGGVTTTDVARARENGARGVAGISHWWLGG